MSSEESTFSYYSKLKALAWLAKHDTSVDESGYPLTLIGRFRKGYALPPQASYQLMLAWKLGRLFSCKKGLFLITDWPLYKEAEMEIFIALRARYAGLSTLFDSPACVFDVSDNVGVEFMVWTIFLLFIFNWQGFIFTLDKSITVWLADEVLEVWAADQDTISKFEQSVSELCLNGSLK